MKTSDEKSNAAAAGTAASWALVSAEIEAAERSSERATRAAGSAQEALKTLHATVAQLAIIDVARSLADGPDGGALGALSAVASDPQGGLSAANARLALERLCAVLLLEQRLLAGEHLELDAGGLAEVDVQGEPPEEGEIWHCIVVQPGWACAGQVIKRPVVVVEGPRGEPAP